MSESSIRVRVILLSSIAYPFFEFDFEQHVMRKLLLIKQDTE